MSQNRGRGASLDYITKGHGLITDAVSTQDWPGEAAVDVSIVNWVKDPSEAPVKFLLDGVEVEGISTALRPLSRDVSAAVALPANRGTAFYGPIPGGSGFILTTEEAQSLLGLADANYRDVVRPYLVGNDIANDPEQSPSRFIIDFGFRTLEEAMAYPAALTIVRERVKPARDRTRRAAYRLNWWRFAEPIRAMRKALAPLGRYIAGTATGKRILFCWCDPWTCPSNATNVFAFEDDYSMGVLSSRIHGHWAEAQSSTLEDRIRYTTTSAFETFPWPGPDEGPRGSIGEATARLIARRQEICRAQQIGLTALYNHMEEGAWADLKALHQKLDEAVAEAYGWPVSIAQDADETNRRLLELNREIADGRRTYEPFTHATPTGRRAAS